jgi:hypothetical protein
VTCGRLALLGDVRAISRIPREDARQAVEREREKLRELINVFTGMQNTLGIGTGAVVESLDEVYVAAFEETGQHIPDRVSGTEQNSPVPPESVRLPLPSFLMANTSPLRAIELALREKQADQLLQELREAIAEKSFLWSHLHRVAPRKTVTTQSRSAIQKINQVIAARSAAYNKCRAALERLEAPSHIREKYKILNREDVGASTSIRNPNESGDARLRLSWIWQMGQPVEGSADLPLGSIRECE